MHRKHIIRDNKKTNLTITEELILSLRKDITCPKGLSQGVLPDLWRNTYD